MEKTGEKIVIECPACGKKWEGAPDRETWTCFHCKCEFPGGVPEDNSITPDAKVSPPKHRNKRANHAGPCSCELGLWATAIHLDLIGKIRADHMLDGQTIVGEADRHVAISLVEGELLRLKSVVDRGVNQAGALTQAIDKQAAGPLRKLLAVLNDGGGDGERVTLDDIMEVVG